MTRTPVPGGSTEHAPAPAPALPAPRSPAGDRADPAAPAQPGQDAAAVPDQGSRALPGGTREPEHGGAAVPEKADTAPGGAPPPEHGAVAAPERQGATTDGNPGPAPAGNPDVAPAGNPGPLPAGQPGAAERVAELAAGQPPRPEPVTLAGPWRRLAAFVLDALVLTLATGALWGRLIVSFANRMGNAAAAEAAHAPAAHGAYGRVWAHTLGPYLIVLVPTIILATVYYWLLTGYWGTTIGKRALGCWVTRSDGRSPAGLRRSLLRALVFVAGGELVPPFFVADNAWLTGDVRRQALHDKAAGTLVVRRRP